MQTYEIVVSGRSVRANSDDMTIVRTSVGIDQAHILFDNEEWLDFPATVTFGQGDDLVTEALAMSSVDGSTEWLAEAYVTIPHEVTDVVGPVRVTVQGTDSQGRHIITAAGSPLSVEEAGDVVLGDVPEDAPTVDQWRQAYSDAVTAANEARSLVSNLSDRIEATLSSLDQQIEERATAYVEPATEDRLGVVMVGDGLFVTADGTLSAEETEAMTDEERSQLRNLARLAAYAFDTTFTDGVLDEGAKVKADAMPIASETSAGVVRPDGATVTIGDDGTLSAWGITHSWDGSVLTIASSSGISSADLLGPPPDFSEVTASVDGNGDVPAVEVTLGGTRECRTIDFAFSGLRGPQGPSGYVLTEEDLARVTDEILARYALVDDTRF